MGEHPLVKWLGAIATIVGLLAVGTSMVMQVQKMQDDVDRTHALLQRVNERVQLLHREHITMEKEVGTVRSVIVAEIDGMEEFLSVEHSKLLLRLSDEGEKTRGIVTTANDDLNYRIGFSSGQNECE